MERESHEGRRRSSRPPGGRAMQRLLQFEQERGFRHSEVPQEEHDEAYLAAIEEMERRSQEGPGIQEPTWRPLGPFSIPHGQTYGYGAGSRPSVSGRISSIAVDPGNPDHILIGSAAGGVWESQDAGASWRPRTDNVRTLTIGAVVFDPSDPSIVYAGTGEGNQYRHLGTGLLRSTDGGSTWAVHATAPFVEQGFYDLVVDPLDGAHLLAATSGNLCESDDGGARWTTRRTTQTWSISMHPAVTGDPNSTKEVFAASRDGLLRSTDGGTMWSAVNLPGAPKDLCPSGRMAVCHAPSDGNVVYVFAAGPNPDDPDPCPEDPEETPTAYLWRRAAVGGEFTPIEPDPDLQTHQAQYDWFAAVAPDDSNVIYLGAIDVHKGQDAATGTPTWSNISAKVSGNSIHPDQHAIVFDPGDANTLYIGNDGGIYRSEDAGDAWESLNKGLCITEIEYLAQHPQYDAWLIAGTQDNGTLRYEGREAWTQVATGDGGDCGVNASWPYYCFHSFYGMNLERSTVGGAEGSWVWVLGSEVKAEYRCLFYPPVEVNGNVVAIAGESVFISSDNGDSWTLGPERNGIPLPPGTAAVASALSIPTPTQILVGTAPDPLAYDSAGGDIYRFDQITGRWQDPIRLTPPRPGGGHISDLYVDPTDINRIWATYAHRGGEHVYRSDNGGTRWNDVSHGLPPIPANALVVDPADTDIVYVGTDVGVWRSTNAGDGGTWTLFGKGLPNAIVGDLLFHPVARLLRAGTRSRGTWEIPVDQQSATPAVELYLRNSIVDTRRIVPSAAAGNDPFQPGAAVNWWSSPDIKVDSAPFQTPSLSEVTFEVFQNDRGVCASGLRDEKVRGLTRIFVQVHNRGGTPANDAAVKVFYADASRGASLPRLPSGFWDNFPNNTMSADSSWQQVAPHLIVPNVETGRPVVAGFEWEPPSALGGVWLLAVVSAANDPVSAPEYDVAPLVKNDRKCVVKRVRVLS
jgi:photosystem II stability/assembly factor-like uncharacterized protein